MRTTLTVDDRLMRKLKQAAVARGISLKELVNRALRVGLETLQEPQPRKRRYRARTFRMGNPRMRLDKALTIAAELDTDEVLRKQALRK